MQITHALVTGPAGAIGGALCEEIRRAWPACRLSLLDINAEGATQTAARLGGDCAVFAVDLSDPEAAVGAWRAVCDAHQTPDLLVNNAGIATMRPIHEISPERAQTLMNLDLTTPLRLMHLAAIEMVHRRHGGIINIASMAGLVPLRGCVFYGGAKAGLGLASENARLDLRPHGVRVVTVYPGPVESALERQARADLGTSFMERLLPMGQPRTLAAYTVRALQQDAPRVIYPPSFSLAARFLNITRAFTAAFSPTPKPQHKTP